VSGRQTKCQAFFPAAPASMEDKLHLAFETDPDLVAAFVAQTLPNSHRCDGITGPCHQCRGPDRTQCPCTEIPRRTSREAHRPRSGRRPLRECQEPGTGTPGAPTPLACFSESHTPDAVYVNTRSPVSAGVTEQRQAALMRGTWTPCGENAGNADDGGGRSDVHTRSAEIYPKRGMCTDVLLHESLRSTTILRVNSAWGARQCIERGGMCAALSIGARSTPERRVYLDRAKFHLGRRI